MPFLQQRQEGRAAGRFQISNSDQPLRNLLHIGIRRNLGQEVSPWPQLWEEGRSVSVDFLTKPQSHPEHLSCPVSIRPGHLLLFASHQPWQENFFPLLDLPPSGSALEGLPISEKPQQEVTSWFWQTRLSCTSSEGALHHSRGYLPPCCLPTAEDPHLSASSGNLCKRGLFHCFSGCSRLFPPPPPPSLPPSSKCSQPVPKFPEVVQQEEEGRRTALCRGPGFPPALSSASHPFL